MISDTITQKIGEAMKAKDEIRLSTLRMLSSALNYEKIDKQHTLSEEEELEVVRREAKKRRDAIEALRQVLRPRAQDRVAQGSGREEDINERIAREEKELAILQEYLPKQMPNSELEKKVKEAISQTGASSMADIGKVMGVVMAKVKGRAEGGKVSELVRKNLP